MEFATKYGYTFEHEATYERMCLVNNAVYVAKYKDGDWTATGTQFQVPYVFKTLFSHEPITFDDLCETKTVSTAIYLDMNEALEDVSVYEKEFTALQRDAIAWGSSPIEDTERGIELERKIAEGHKYSFIGKVGRFCPIKPGGGGGILLREAFDKKTGKRKFTSVNGATDYRWKEAEVVQTLGQENLIDRSYYNRLVDAAVETISKFGDVYQFIDVEGGASPWFNPSEPWSDEPEATPFDVR